MRTVSMSPEESYDIYFRPDEWYMIHEMGHHIMCQVCLLKTIFVSWAIIVAGCWLFEKRNIFATELVEVTGKYYGTLFYSLNT